MNTRRSMKLPIIIVFIFIVIVVSFFTSIKQKEVTCRKRKEFSNVVVDEVVISKIDSKRIRSIDVTKTIYFNGNHNSKDIEKVVDSLDNTLSYLDKKVKYTISEDKIIIHINVNKNEVVLLDNIIFNNLEVKVNSNTKSSDVITLKVLDNYTDGEYMKRLKGKGYRCK